MNFQNLKKTAGSKSAWFPQWQKKAVLFGSLIFLLMAFGRFRTTADPFEPYKEPLYRDNEGIEMQPVSGGVFTMGSEDGGKAEQPPHQVEVSDFWMATFELTWDQYEYYSQNRDNTIFPGSGTEVKLDVDAISSATTPYVDMSYGMGKRGYPVVNVTQHAALTFCKWLSAKTGRFYRLPTEAEWEYACRAGSTEAYSFGKDSSRLDEYAWYKGNSDGHYHKVGLKEPNAFGLYDMHGNVAEWTLDKFNEDTYKKRSDSENLNPWVVPDELYPRVVRGGSWQDNPEDLRSFSRRGSDPAWKRIDPQVPKSRWWFTNAPFVGFRIVRPRVTPPPEEIAAYWLEAIDEY